MGTLAAPLTLYNSLFAGLVPGAFRKIAQFKDLSDGGACQTGYGDRTAAHRALQYSANLKHAEKHAPYLRWAAAVVPAFLDVIPKIIYQNHKRTPLRDIPSRTHTVLTEKNSNISAEQLGFLICIIPLYNNARTIKNHFWTGNGLDPSGHTLFKIAQYGMMYSIATEHGTKPKINTPNVYYLAATAMADVVMLGNTIAYCHTFTEIAFGGGMGIAVLLIAHLISTHTQLGEYVQRAAKTALQVVGTLGSRVTQSVMPVLPHRHHILVS